MEALMNTIKENYKIALVLGFSRVEAREIVLETLKDMGFNINITDEVLNAL